MLLDLCMTSVGSPIMTGVLFVVTLTKVLHVTVVSEANTTLSYHPLDSAILSSFSSEAHSSPPTITRGQ